MISIDMLNDVEIKLKNNNKILFYRDSLVLQELLKLIRLQNHRTLVLWAFMTVEKIVDKLKIKFPNEKRIDNAIELCKQWAQGEVKMPVAKKAILEVHQIAKEIDDAVDIALIHAIGQGCAVVHVETHAVGIVVYELSAIVIKFGIKNCAELIDEKLSQYISDLKLCIKKAKEPNLKWSNFLLDDTKANKEMLLYNKLLLKEG